MPTSARSRRTRRPTRSRGLAGVVLAGVLALGVVPTTTVAQAAGGSARSNGSNSDVTMVHANIKSDLSVDRFQADVREVLAKHPDVITYNEVPLRQDAVLAPDGYDIHRSMDSRYTAATAVAWRSDRWSVVDSGTYKVSNYRKIPPGRHIRLGLRFANWVTLVSTDGRTLSVVAAHVAPLDRHMPDLLRPSVRRVGELVERLSASGPVLVGGDFNVHYTSGRYPEDLLDDAGMVPTYDTLGGYFPTGDHQGATIDYVFNRGEGALVAAQQSKFEMNSDHDGVVAGFDWTQDPPEATQRFVSDPEGNQEARRVVVSTIRRGLVGAEPGTQVDVVSSGFGPYRLYRPVRRAIARGVDVRLLTRSQTLTERERRVAELIREEGVGGSEVRRCRDACLKAWRRSGMARGFVLVRDAKGRAVERMDVNRYLNEAILERRATLTVSTGEIGLRRGEEMLDSLP